jgi:hypothetical protein
MNKLINSILNRLSPMQKDNIYTTDKTMREGTSTLFKSGADVIHKNHRKISNSPALGLALEQLQAIGFYLNTEFNNLQVQADQVSVDRITKYNSDIYINIVGEIIAEILAKASSQQSIKQPIHLEKPNLSGAEIIINTDSIKSFTINPEFAQWVAENPYLAANLMCAAATVGELSGAAIKGGMINATTQILLQSIQPLQAYCKNEQDMDMAELYNLLQLSVDSLKQGFIRGSVIKVLQKLIKSSASTALGFTIKSSVISVLILVMQDEITIQKGISIVGIKAFTSGIIRIVVLLFPSVGLALLSHSVIQDIWKELTPQWQEFINTTAQKKSYST